jgi:hypothetical protein
MPPPTPTTSTGFNWGFLSNVADAVPTVIGQLNPKTRENQLAIAEANRDAALAQAQAQTAQPRNNSIVWVAVIIAVLIIAALLLKRK